MITWFALLVTSWATAGGLIMYGALTTRRIHWDVALFMHVIVVLLIMVGVVCLYLAGQAP